jgi:hypothetical protein
MGAMEVETKFLRLSLKIVRLNLEVRRSVHKSPSNRIANSPRMAKIWPSSDAGQVPCLQAYLHVTPAAALLDRRLMMAEAQGTSGACSGRN